MNILIKLHHFLLSPKSKDLQLSQREYILNIVLLGLIFIFSVLTTLSVSYYFFYKDDFTGESPIYVFLTLLFFVVLLILSKKGKIFLARWLLVLVFILFANMVAIISGVENPITLLLFAWTFSLIGVLIGRTAAIVLFFLTSTNLLVLTYLQMYSFLEPDLHWKIIKLDFGLGISYISVLLIIALISSLYNRQITNSLNRALKSEKELQLERDLLEERVLQRTKELEKIQIEQISQLSKFAEFGKSMSGLLHDLINPITAISLNLEQLNNITDENKIEEARDCSKRALSVATKMEEFVVSTKNRLRNKPDIKKFCLKDEINEVVKFFIFKARKKNIVIKILITDNLYLIGDVVKFDQVISNLIANSIDAFEVGLQEKNNIYIKSSKLANSVQIIIEDNGSGIREDIMDEIFKPFFTTKEKREGVGIGLYITKSIIENDFAGEIKVKSSQGKGTKFYITIPNKNEIKN